MYPNNNSHKFSPNNSRNLDTSLQKWGSPAQCPITKSHQQTGARQPNSNNVRFSPYRKNPGQGFESNRQFSPRFNAPPQFRTPQPVQRFGYSQHSRGGQNNDMRFSRSPVKGFNNYKNRRYDANCNPGGSNDISQYYHPSMIQDPWLMLKPSTIRQAPPPST